MAYCNTNNAGRVAASHDVACVCNVQVFSAIINILTVGGESSVAAQLARYSVCPVQQGTPVPYRPLRRQRSLRHPSCLRPRCLLPLLGCPCHLRYLRPGCLRRPRPLCRTGCLRLRCLRCLRALCRLRCLCLRRRTAGLQHGRRLDAGAVAGQAAPQAGALEQRVHCYRSELWELAGCRRSSREGPRGTAAALSCDRRKGSAAQGVQLPPPPAAREAGGRTQQHKGKRQGRQQQTYEGAVAGHGALKLVYQLLAAPPQQLAGLLLLGGLQGGAQGQEHLLRICGKQQVRRGTVRLRGRRSSSRRAATYQPSEEARVRLPRKTAGRHFTRALPGSSARQPCSTAGPPYL